MVQALRRSRARLIRGLAAAAVLAAVAGFSVLAAERAHGVPAALGIGGVVLLLGGVLVRASDLAAAGVALAGGAYAFVVLVGGEGLDLRTPAVAAALVLAAELAYSALNPPLVPAAAVVRALRIARIVGAVLLGLAASGLVLLASTAQPGSAAALLQVAGVLAAVAALALLALLARRLT